MIITASCFLSSNYAEVQYVHEQLEQSKSCLSTQIQRQLLKIFLVIANWPDPSILCLASHQALMACVFIRKITYTRPTIVSSYNVLHGNKKGRKHEMVCWNKKIINLKYFILLLYITVLFQQLDFIYLFFNKWHVMLFNQL